MNGTDPDGRQMMPYSNSAKDALLLKHNDAETFNQITKAEGKVLGFGAAVTTGAAIVAEVGVITTGTALVEGVTAEVAHGGATVGLSATGVTAAARNGKVGDLMTKAGEVFSGFSKKAARSADVTRATNPTVQTALDAVPSGQRSAFHGACCEIDAMSQALNAGADVIGATMGVVTDVRTGAAVAPCASCMAVKETLGVK